MSRTLRAGIIGLGMMGRNQCESCNRCPMSSWLPRWTHSNDLIMLR